MKKQTMNRRSFLRRATATALGSSTAMATLSRLQMAHAQTTTPTDYKALVCIFLYGGNDAFNMVVPRSTAEYNSYAATRQTLALAQDNLLAIEAPSQGGMEFGFNPELTDVAQLYRDGRLAVLGNVGALREPTSKTAYQNKSVLLPPQLFSHNDQQSFMQSLQSSRQRNGWAGRAADAMMDMNINDRLSMNISLSGSNLWQTGSEVFPYALSPQGIENLNHLSRTTEDAREQARTAAYEALLGQNQNHLFAREYAATQSRAWDLADEVGAALTTAPEINTPMPQDNRLAASLAMTARTIAARGALDVSRQTFFIGMGDFDTHGDQMRRHELLMTQLNDALKYFYDVTVELGIENKVTTFTASDFGRTLTSNGDGTDHGWGGHQLIMGGQVNGGDIYGTMPDLTIGGNDDMGEGRIIPTTSIDQYAATLAGWYGLSAGSYGDVFPNLANFDQVDLGFMGS